MRLALELMLHTSICDSTLLNTGILLDAPQQDMFLSAGADGSVRLYHALRQQPLLTLEPTAQQLYSVKWSPSRPLVFATSGGMCVC